jgi:hypothetical protein
MAKAAVLLCQGCNIASSLDMGSLEKVAGKCEGVIHTRSVPFLCDEAGAQAIDEALALGANALVIAACAPRFHTHFFARQGHTERVSLRELGVYSHEPKHEDTQMLAEDMVRMGAARATKVEIPEPQPLPVERTVLVVGGGPSGISAALGAARAGYGVVLVEKQRQLGGWLRFWKRTLPSRAPYRELESPGSIRFCARLPSIRASKFTAMPNRSASRGSPVSSRWSSKSARKSSRPRSAPLSRRPGGNPTMRCACRIWDTGVRPTSLPTWSLSAPFAPAD